MVEHRVRFVDSAGDPVVPGSPAWQQLTPAVSASVARLVSAAWEVRREVKRVKSGGTTAA